MVDWTKSMQQTFEYYIVDPNTWKNASRLENVKSCTINRDSDSETLGSASINVANVLGECYVRVYLVTSQNGATEKHPLGTFLVQTPSSNFNGRIRNVTMDAYTPLIELKENKPPIGYTILKNANIMDNAYMLARENVRAPVSKPKSSETLYKDFVASTEDTWMSFLIDLVANAKFEFSLDELGRILFNPKQEVGSLQPVWTFNDNNSSILLPEISMDHDLYGIPNVVEVVYSEGGKYYCSRVKNEEESSPISIVNRGREIVYREVNPSLAGMPSQRQLDEYATNLLKTLSFVEYTVSYSHGYCSVRLGDCVRLNYAKAGITDVKAKVINQSINCSSGCQVTETAVFTTKLWR